MREHFIDSWAAYTKPNVLVKDLDGFEAIKSFPRTWNARYNSEKRFEWPRYVEKEPEIIPNSRDKIKIKVGRKFSRKQRKTCALSTEERVTES